MTKSGKKNSSYPFQKLKAKNKILLVNVENYETRVALMNKGKLSEIVTERKADRGIIGNIYKGRVDRIVPGIGAAFVDIGVGKNCFLYVSDIYYDMKSYESWLSDTDDATVDSPLVDPIHGDEENLPHHKHDEKDARYPVTIEDLLQEGQDILVQIVKEPLGKKGARATSHITLPGRFLVLMPTIRHIGISRKIQNGKERDRLRNMVKKLVPEEMGIIVRTAAEGATEEEFERDCNYLTSLWNKIQKRSDTSHAPSLIHHDLGLTFRVVRDMFNETIDALIIDSEEEYEKIFEIVNNVSPELKNRVYYHDIADSIFDVYDVESQIDKHLQRKIWLKSGGHIYIDEAEALVAIDVNTGKFTGGQDIEQTLVKTNIEAAKEIAHQIRARGLGGLLVVDFIDMKGRSNQRKVYESFLDALKDDRERYTVLEMTEVGLIQMTRRRVRPSLLKSLTQPCPYCEGNGVILSSDTMAIKVLRELKKVCRMTSKAKVMIKVHPDLHKILNDEMESELLKLGETYRKTISIMPDPKLHFEKYNIELQDI
jgi:ribonuclease G